jgi:hypothetical protein
MRESKSSKMMRVQPLFPGQRSRGWMIAALLLVSFGWNGLPVARAGCSHLVTMKADAARLRLARLDHLLFAEELATDMRVGSPLGEHSAPPCSGFLCSGTPVPLIPLLSPQSLPRIDAWSRLDFGLLACGASQSPISFDDDSPHQKDRVDRLIRPPR